MKKKFVLDKKNLGKKPTTKIDAYPSPYPVYTVVIGRPYPQPPEVITITKYPAPGTIWC